MFKRTSLDDAVTKMVYEVTKWPVFREQPIWLDEKIAYGYKGC